MGRILIVGAGIAGQLLAEDLNRDRQHTVVGFVDDGLSGKGVLGVIGDMPKLVDRFKVDEIVIAVPSADGGLYRRILLLNERSRVPIRLVPRAQRVLRDNRVKYKDVKELAAEDFLGRPLDKARVKALTGEYHGKTVVVTGGAGSIGSEVAKQLLELGAERVVVFDHSEYFTYSLCQELRDGETCGNRCEFVLGSVTDRDRVEQVIRSVRPDFVFHAAAYKHVPLMEENVEEAVKVNVLGTRNVVDVCIKWGVGKFVLVSTDKAVNPTSVMGASKKMAEEYVRSVPGRKTVVSVVRFGNVINSQGSVLPLFSKQIFERRYVTITEKRMRRYFMSIKEAVQLILISATQAAPGAVHVLDMGDLVSIEEVARCLIRARGFLCPEDVKLRYIGRRLGEKIEEELFGRQEKQMLVQTGLENIWRVNNSRPSRELVRRKLDQLTAQLAKSIQGAGGATTLARLLLGRYNAVDNKAGSYVEEGPSKKVYSKA